MPGIEAGPRPPTEVTFSGPLTAEGPNPPVTEGFAPTDFEGIGFDYPELASEDQQSTAVTAELPTIPEVGSGINSENGETPSAIGTEPVAAVAEESPIVRESKMRARVHKARDAVVDAIEGGGRKLTKPKAEKAPKSGLDLSKVADEALLKQDEVLSSLLDDVKSGRLEVVENAEDVVHGVSVSKDRINKVIEARAEIEDQMGRRGAVRGDASTNKKIEKGREKLKQESIASEQQKYEQIVASERAARIKAEAERKAAERKERLDKGMATAKEYIATKKQEARDENEKRAAEIVKTAEVVFKYNPIAQASLDHARMRYNRAKSPAEEASIRSEIAALLGGKKPEEPEPSPIVPVRSRLQRPIKRPLSRIARRTKIQNRAPRKYYTGRLGGPIDNGAWAKRERLGRY